MLGAKAKARFQKDINLEETMVGQVATRGVAQTQEIKRFQKTQWADTWFDLKKQTLVTNKEPAAVAEEPLHWRKAMHGAAGVMSHQVVYADTDTFKTLH